jgi:anti-sigma B factor antagonist/stage II sporulation protein AA (anti-sigma F factor antagonist)
VKGLQIDLEEIEERILLRLEGRIDAISAPTLEKKLRQLIDEQRLFLLLDLTQVDYVSSAGLRVLLAMSKKVHGKQGYLVLFSLQEEVAAIFKMAGFDRILSICQNETEALQFRK